MKRQALVFGLLLAVLLSLGWWLRELTRPDETLRQATRESPNAYAEGLTVHTYDLGGRLQQTLKTPHMEHYASTDTSHLTRPLLWRFSPDAPAWRMRAEKALANDETGHIFLPGEVVIERDAAPSYPPYHLVTRDLTLETDSAHATTGQPVLIESDQQRITAVGMEGWLRAPIKLHLLSQVRAYYEFD